MVVLGSISILHACLFTLVSFGTLSLSNSSLLWTKALAGKTISTVTLFVLLITYAHIWERSGMLSVPCHRTHVLAFTFFSAFPWRVTYSYLLKGSLSFPSLLMENGAINPSPPRNSVFSCHLCFPPCLNLRLKFFLVDCSLPCLSWLSSFTLIFCLWSLNFETL